MKKVLAIVFVAILALTCVISVAAAGSINANEQKVLDALGKTAKVSGATFKIPSQYINQAKNYFLTVDLTKEEADTIIAKINAAIAAIEKAKVSVSGSELDLHDLDRETRATIFANATEACEAIGLRLVYDGTDNAVVITNEAGEAVFEDEAVIKKTGSEVNVTVAALIVVVLTVVAAAGVVVTKKAQLF